MLKWQPLNRYERRMMKTLNLIFHKHSHFLEFLFEIDQRKVRDKPKDFTMREGGVFASEEKQSLFELDWIFGMADVMERLDFKHDTNILQGHGYLKQDADDDIGIVWRQRKTAHLKRVRVATLKSFS